MPGEKERRPQLLQRIGQLCEAHSDDWSVEEQPGALLFIYDPSARSGDESAEEEAPKLRRTRVARALMRKR